MFAIRKIEIGFHGDRPDDGYVEIQATGYKRPCMDGIYGTPCEEEECCCNRLIVDARTP